MSCRTGDLTVERGSEMRWPVAGIVGGFAAVIAVSATVWATSTPLESESAGQSSGLSGFVTQCVGLSP